MSCVMDTMPTLPHFRLEWCSAIYDTSRPLRFHTAYMYTLSCWSAVLFGQANISLHSLVTNKWGYVIMSVPLKLDCRLLDEQQVHEIKSPRLLSLPANAFIYIIMAEWLFSLYSWNWSTNLLLFTVIILTNNVNTNFLGGNYSSTSCF